MHHVAEELTFSSDFAISQLCSKYTVTKQFSLDENIVLESGKFLELDELLPAIKQKVLDCKFHMTRFQKRSLVH